MSTTTADDSTGRKGRSNAILTYEEISAINNQLTVVNGKLDRVAEKLAEGNEKYLDHEARIRVLERTLTEQIAAGTQSKSIWLWVWGAVMSLPSVVFSILNYLKP